MVLILLFNWMGGMKLIVFLERPLVFTLFFLFSALNALDMPVFYRAPFFQGMPQKSGADWTTGLAVRYGAGSTATARDVGQCKRPLLSMYDSLDITMLGVGLQNPGVATTRLWGSAAALMVMSVFRNLILSYNKCFSPVFLCKLIFPFVGQSLMQLNLKIVGLL